MALDARRRGEARLRHEGSHPIRFGLRRYFGMGKFRLRAVARPSG